jgi:hypothetical protein
MLRNGLRQRSQVLALPAVPDDRAMMSSRAARVVAIGAEIRISQTAISVTTQLPAIGLSSRVNAENRSFPSSCRISGSSRRCDWCRCNFPGREP